MFRSALSLNYLLTKKNSKSDSVKYLGVWIDDRLTTLLSQLFSIKIAFGKQAEFLFDKYEFYDYFFISTSEIEEIYKNVD